MKLLKRIKNISAAINKVPAADISGENKFPSRFAI
jgi:hypothetical protein